MNAKVKLPNNFMIMKRTSKRNGLCICRVGTDILVSHKIEDKRRPLNLVEGFGWKVTKCGKCQYQKKHSYEKI